MSEKNFFYNSRRHLKVVARAILVWSSLLWFTHEVYSQQDSFYPLNKNKVEAGISGGLLYILYSNVELSITLNRRISEKIVIEAKPVLGLITQLYLFEGNESPYKITYKGGTMGFNYGKKNKLFELTFGLASFYSETNAWGSSTNGIKPIGTIAYKKVNAKSTFRFGVGIPHGVFVGLNYRI